MIGAGASERGALLQKLINTASAKICVLVEAGRRIKLDKRKKDPSHLRRAPGDGPGQDDAALAVDDHGTVVVGDGGRAAAGDGGEHEEEEGQRERHGGHGATTDGGAWEEHHVQVVDYSWCV